MGIYSLVRLRKLTKYLITGGAGFIGSHLAHSLVEHGHDVRVVDDLSTGLASNVPGGVDFVRGDLSNPTTAIEVVRGCEVVLHQAAIPSVPRSIDAPRDSHEANIDATFNVLLASRDEGVRRVVYAASSSAYGESKVLPKNEEMSAAPRSPYALQKYTGEQYCQLFTQLYGLETVSIRYFNVFGPRQQPSSPYSGVLSLFIRAALTGAKPTIYGDGEQTRDFTYIDNVIDGVLRAVTSSKASGEVINVACGGRISLNSAWSALEDIVGISLPVPNYAESRPGDVRDSQADITKAELLLGYHPLIAFADGLRRTVAWAQNIVDN